MSAPTSVPAVKRAAAILDHVAIAIKPQGVSEIARLLDLPKSSVHGLCHTLVALGLLRETIEGFELGSHVLQWSAAFLNKDDLARDFERVLATDNRLADYTVTLSVLQGDRVVYIGCRNAHRPLGFSFQIGMGLPAVFTATGKAMLSRLKREERDRILHNAWPRPLTAHSVADRAAFEHEVELGARRPYALDDGQVRDGMYCIGAPIYDAHGHPIAGLAISLTRAEAQPDLVAQLGAVIADLACTLSRNRP